MPDAARAPNAHSRRTMFALGVLAAAFMAAYFPDLGHGFLKDDFGWILRGRSDGIRDVLELFTEHIGFYRPLVTATFAVDEAIWHFRPIGYSLTNLAICVADAILLAVVVRRLALPLSAAIFAAAVWAFNPHGINMALLWLSGRTALLVVLFALGTAWAMLRQRSLLAGLLSLGGMLCKEEAVVLPALWTMFLVAEGGVSRTWRELVRRTWPQWAALAVYAFARLQTGAFGPLDAPPEYRLFSSAALIGKNLTEYADRAGTAFAIPVIVLGLLAWGRHAGWSGDERRALRLAAVWFPLTFLLTFSLPVRSSLYVLLPTVACALVVAAFASRAMRANARGFGRAATAFVVIAVLLVPMYRSRNRRWVDGAKLSAEVVRLVQETTAARPGGGRMLLVANPDVRPNFEDTFLVAFPEVLILYAGRQWTGDVVDRDIAWQDPAAIVVELIDGRPVIQSHGVERDSPKTGATP